jgi:hypothetical protein
MAKRRPVSAEQKQFRAAAGMLFGAVCGVAVAGISALALVPRVRLVEVLGVIAGGIGAGAGLVGAIFQFKTAREAVRHGRQRQLPPEAPH